MKDDNFSPAGTPPQRKSRLRSTLMASAAGVGIAILVAGGGYFNAFTPFAPSQGVAYASEATGEPVGFADLVAKVKPAVISVRVRIEESANRAEEDQQGDQQQQNDPDAPLYKFFHQFGPDQGQQQHQMMIGEGSGFFISADGYAVTNNHVVDHAKSVQVTTNDGTIYTAKVVGTDPKSDLALLKVDANKDFPYVKFAEHEPRVGDWVVAVGNPFGLGGTVTAGIVSARGRDIGGSPYDDYLQIDAPINKGNSGGPAFNVNGNVIGVNTAIFSPSGGSVGIGFDIPSDTVKMVIDQLKTKGYVTRGWMGVQVQAVTPGIAESLGMKKAEGALVDQPQPDSPAAKAGIKVGDVITEVNGSPVKDARTLAQKIALGAPGHTVKLNILRNNEERTIDLTLAAMPRQRQANAQGVQQDKGKEPQLGLNLAPAEDVAGSGDTGVVVLKVDPNSPAAENGMQSGDVILDVSGKAVQNPGEVRQAVDQSRSQGKHAVLLRVKTAQGTRFVAIPFAQG